VPEVTDGGETLPEGVELVRAPNTGYLTLSGTNTYLFGSPAWVVDPGPDDTTHIERVYEVGHRRGGIEGIMLTHRHADHAGGAGELRRLAGAPIAVAATSGDPPASGFREQSVEELEIDTELAHGDRVGPFEVISTPGHSPDHLAFLTADDVLFCGDTVLGEGSVFIPPGQDSMREYMATLAKLRLLSLACICPGHGPVIWDARAKLDEYLAHREDRERRLVEALASGLRTRSELLDSVWSEVPPQLRPPAALTLEAHLEKLEVEGRLPAGVERLSS
jgi:glyoxylase-like metal-dependent hydrolase (beta-lactamase superfamily II)